MPTWLRRFHIQKINEFRKEENEQIEKAKGNANNPNSSNVARGPNVTPSSTYNFKK